MVLGTSVGGAQAAEMGVVDQAVEGESGALEAAMEQAEALARYRGPVISTIRTTLYPDLLALIDAERTT